jgi:hypothetical protein
MPRSSNWFTALACIAFALVCGSTPVLAQWWKYPTAGVPRTPDGKVNLSAPTPRTPDGKPDFTGIWITGNPNCAQRPSDDSIVCGVENERRTAAVVSTATTYTVRRCCLSGAL